MVGALPIGQTSGSPALPRMLKGKNCHSSVLALVSGMRPGPLPSASEAQP